MFDSVSDQNKAQEMYDKIVSDDPSKIKYCHDKYNKTQTCVIKPLMSFYQH